MLPQFNDPSLLETALTHRSALNEGASGSAESNERLEYLGDAVLQLATSQFLYKRFPTEPEGKLTAYRSALVKTSTLAELAIELALGPRILMSKGEENTGGRENTSLLANTSEAVIGALYLDQGMARVVTFLEKHLFPKVENVLEAKDYKDAKSLLQEKVQALGLPTPSYKVVKAVGPDHDKHFTIEVRVKGKLMGSGSGSSKQRAQQQAAQVAVEKY